MIKAYFVLCSILVVSTTLAEFYDLDDNNFIEYNSAASAPWPYAYRVEEKPIFKKPAKIYVPPKTEVAKVEKPGFISTAVSCVFNAIKTGLSFIISHIPGLAVGIIAALGLCKLTPLCSSHVSLLEAQSELTSLATPERITRAANFVKEAVRKFQAMQK